MRKRNIKDWPVMKSKCSTCPFGPNGDRRTQSSVTESVVNMKGSQICHHPVLKGKPETHLCRGARDLQLRVLAVFGVIEDATDAAYNRKRESLGV